MNNLVTENQLIITEEQSRTSEYQRAIREEIEASRYTTVESLRTNAINHPEILRYKNRILGECDTYEYTDWLHFLKQDFGPKESSLSLGSGIGRVEKYLIETGFTNGFETIELSPHSNQNARRSNVSIQAVEGDLNFVHLPEDSYDFILCHGVLHHLINLEYILHQINQALKSEGILLIYEYVGETRWQFDDERLKMLCNTLPNYRFKRPHRWIGGFESVRSGDLLQLIQAQFGSNCDRSISFGGVYFPFAICNGTFKFRNDEVQKIVQIDEQFSKNCAVMPCYHMGVYHKSHNPPTTCVPWTNDQLYQHLGPRKPYQVLIADMAQQILHLAARKMNRSQPKH